MDSDDGTLGRRPGNQRCGAIGLWRRDCPHPKLLDSVYCYYHDKLQKGLLEPSAAELYPVWPLPVEGYVFTDTTGNRAVA